MPEQHDLQSHIREIAEEMLGVGRTEVSTIRDEVKRRVPELVYVEGGRLIDRALDREIKELMRRWSQDPIEQHELQGFQLPRAIAVRQEGGSVTYVSMDQASWDDVLAGEAERVNNILAAQARHREYTDAMDLLRPWMTGLVAPDGTQPAATVREAASRRTTFEDAGQRTGSAA